MPEEKRCPWCLGDPLMIAYHDQEWGKPTDGRRADFAMDGKKSAKEQDGADRRHFEFLILEGAQAGLSWKTILHRREEYCKEYAGFDAKAVAAFGDADVERLMLSGIIKNRLKIRSSINNARLFLDIQKEFGSFDSYIWGFSGGVPVINRWKTMAEIPARTELSDRIAADLKKRGFKFAGSTIMYAHLQAVGIVNDHLESCPFR